MEKYIGGYLKMSFEEKFKKAQQFMVSENFVIDDKRLKIILATIEEGIPLLLVGPTGSGKTHFLGLLAKHLGGDYRYQSLNGSITIHDLTQERIIGDKGNFVNNDMILTDWLRDSQTKKSVLQLDEVNAAKAETLLSLHSIMDIKGELYLPYSKETLKVNKNAVLVMSCNEGDEYEGTNAMNMAFQNRYVKVYFPYIQGDVLANLLTNKTKVPIEDTKKIVNTWEKYMLSRDPEQPVVSIRILEYWCRMSKYLGLKGAGEATFASLIAENEEDVIKIIEGDFFVNLE